MCDRKRGNSMFIGYYNIANLVTLSGLMFSAGACFCSLSHDFKSAVALFLCACFCDVFDGRIARSLQRTKVEKTFGVQIDTVCDMVSFGFTPVVIGYSCFDNPSPYLLMVFFFFGATAGIRLAYFNTEAIEKNDNMEMHHYTGLPVPASCIMVPALLIVHHFIQDDTVAQIIFAVTYALVGCAFIGNFKIKKFGTLPTILFLLVVLGLIAVSLFTDWLVVV